MRSYEASGLLVDSRGGVCWSGTREDGKVREDLFGYYQKWPEMVGMED